MEDIIKAILLIIAVAIATRVFLFIVNFIFTIIGLAIVAFGVFALIQGSFLVSLIAIAIGAFIMTKDDNSTFIIEDDTGNKYFIDKGELIA